MVGLFVCLFFFGWELPAAFMPVWAERHLERERRLKQPTVAQTIGALIAVKLCIHSREDRCVVLINTSADT